MSYLAAHVRDRWRNLLRPDSPTNQSDSRTIEVSASKTWTRAAPQLLIHERRAEVAGVTVVNSAFVECPHCYTRVLPSVRGQCPSCLKNVRGQVSRFTAVDIEQDSKLPNHCCLCDANTERVVTVHANPQSLQKRVLAVALLVLILPFSLVMRPVGTLVALGSLVPSEGTGRFKVRLPQCRECAKQGVPRPRHVDFARRQMTFVVTKAFHARLRSRP